jgi:hypothetical protein
LIRNTDQRIRLDKEYGNQRIRLDKEYGNQRIFRCGLSVRLQSYQVKVAIDLHPRPTLQVLQVFRNVFQVFRHLQVRLIKDIGILSLGIRKIKDIGILSLGIRKIKDIGLLFITIEDNGYFTEYTETTG